MEIRKAVLIATFGLTAIGCDAGELMPSQPEGRGGTGARAGSGGSVAGRGGPSGRGGTAGAAATSVPPGPGVALVTNTDGWLEPNPAGAVGQWWGVGDYYGEDFTPGTGP